jgi:hypothetical protein
MAQYPETDCALVLCDIPSQGYQVDKEAFRVCLAKDIASAAFELNTLRYDVLELSTSIKAQAFAHFFEEGYDEVVFLDPDLYFYSPLEELDASFASGTQAILTPHVLEPLSLGLTASQALVRDGSYNLGFLALAKSKGVIDFLTWWGARLDEACLVATELGYFTDQKWCDLLPSFVDKAVVLRHPGYNVAYWNLHERGLSLDHNAHENPKISAQGQALRFVHFSGALGLAPGAISKHAPTLDTKAFPAFGTLLATYLEELGSHALKEKRDYICDYDVDAAGHQIPRTVRQLFREELLPQFDPLSVPRDKALKVMIDYALAPDPNLPQDATFVITRFMRRLWQGRPDLRLAFDLHQQIGRVGFCTWFGRAALGELRLPTLYHPAKVGALTLLHPSTSFAVAGSVVRRIVKRLVSVLPK